MTETAVHEPSPAQQIGLVDGQFLVQRTGGALEQGWQVGAIHKLPIEGEPGKFHTKVDLYLRDASGNDGLAKPGVSLERLQSWQPKVEEAGVEDDTVPRQTLIEMGALPVGQVVEDPGFSSVVPDQAVGSDVVEPDTPVQGPTSALDTDDGMSGSPVVDMLQKSEPKPEQSAEPAAMDRQEVFEPKIHAVEDIAERLGLDRGAEVAVVETTLRTQLLELDAMARSLAEFAPHGKLAARQIDQTLHAGRSQLNGPSRAEINGFLDGPYASLAALARDDGKLAAMPAPIRKAIETQRRQILKLDSDARVMMGANMPRNLDNAFDTGPAQQVKSTLGKIEDLAKKAVLSRQIVEDELAQVIGFKRVNQEHAAREKANPRVPKLAEVLGAGKRTETGAVLIRGELRDAFIASLGDAASPQPTDQQIQAGINRALALVNDGGADGTLFRMPFVANKELRSGDRMTRTETAVYLDEPVYINPDRIISAAGFDSWMGRGHEGTGDAGTKDGKPKTIRSIDKIKDYAARETALKVVNADDRMTLIQADNGIFMQSNSDHRVAAAKLRGEPIGVEAFDVFRYAGNL